MPRQSTTSCKAAQRVARPQRRPGFTLIEMLIAISVLSAMVGISVTLLSGLLRSERKGVAHVAQLTTLSRLARQFRADVHAATVVEKADGDAAKPLLQITTDDQRQIQYAIQPQGLLRTETGPARPAPSRELMRLKDTRFRIEESPAPPRIVTLIIETLNAKDQDPKQPGGASSELRIDAVVGRNLRDL